MMAFLTPYSPELNPDEQVWNYAKREVGKKIARSKDEMEKPILSVMSTISKCAKLIRIFFRMPVTKYASLDFGK
jgi:transposase